MITIQDLKNELTERIATSVALKQTVDSAKTKVKRDYTFKKLKKNNIFISNLLTTLEKREFKIDELNAARNSEEES